MFLLVIPLVIILCSYGYIFIVSYKQRKNIRGQNNIPGMATAIKHEMKGASTLAIVVDVCPLTIIPLVSSRGRPSVFRRTSRMWPLKQNVNEVCCFWLRNSFKREVVRRWDKRAWRFKWRICHKKKIAWMQSNIFQTLGANSGNRDFGNKKWEKKPLYQLSLYLYESYTYPKVTKMSL